MPTCRHYYLPLSRLVVREGTAALDPPGECTHPHSRVLARRLGCTEGACPFEPARRPDCEGFDRLRSTRDAS